MLNHLAPLRRVLPAALLAWPLTAAAADSSSPEAAAPAPAPTAPDRRGAAEKVQEGNVEQWIEYYRRTRPPVAPVASPPAEKPASPDTK